MAEELTSKGGMGIGFVRAEGVRKPPMIGRLGAKVDAMRCSTNPRTLGPGGSRKRHRKKKENKKTYKRRLGGGGGEGEGKGTCGELNGEERVESGE